MVGIAVDGVKQAVQPGQQCSGVLAPHKPVNSSPFHELFSLKPALSISGSPCQQRHTLHASEFRNLTPQDTLSVFEFQREAEKFTKGSRECLLMHAEVLSILGLCSVLFMGWFKEGQLLAFIIRSGWDKEKLQKVKMPLSVHVHVLAVHRHCRQQGRAFVLLWRYLQYLRCLPGVRRALLICEAFLVPFYEKAGFKENAPSDISVGSFCFREMEYTLRRLSYTCRNSSC
uniref:Serotonin N-acetyltransferase n=1 Tax=Electrophorus electricus TaxID=8005 RepID=A0AAY5ELH4_ELEEL